jgi:hypothetical protein
MLIAGWGVAYALPFLELIRSEISRFRARFGSKLVGSQAFTLDNQLLLGQVSKTDGAIAYI